MSILWVEHIETRMTWQQSGTITRQAIYDVMSDNTFEDPYEVMLAVNSTVRDPDYDPEQGIPNPQLRTPFQWGDESWPVWPGFKDDTVQLDTYDIKLRNPSESRFIWRAIMQYKNGVERTGQMQYTQGNATTSGAAGDDVTLQSSVPYIRPTSPLDIGVKWGGSFFTVEEPATIDLDNKPVANSAGQPYPEQMADYAFDTLIVEFNTATISLGQRASACNAYNSAAFWGFPIGVLALKAWKWGLYHWADSQQYISNQLEFWVKSNLSTWNDHKIPDWATARLEQGEQQALLMQDEFGRALPSTPRMLNGSGEVATPGDVYLNSFRFKNGYSFGTIPGLPTELPTAVTS